jgi:hypothetical protein
MKGTPKYRALAEKLASSNASSKNAPMIPIADVATTLGRGFDVATTLSNGRGFDSVHLLPGSTYQDNSTIIIVPTLGMVHIRVVQSWLSLMGPMNQKRHWHFAVGDEVGRAYDNAIKSFLAHPDLSKWKYVLTLEDDNIQPVDAHIRLLESIEWGKYDAISGIYFTKGEYQMPMAYGDPAEYRRTGVLDFRPRDIRNALAAGHIMPVNGIACGCSLYRMELFKELQPPWFVTVSDVTPTGAQAFTQDLWFWNQAAKRGKTCAVDLRVKVGHIDTSTGIIY